SGDEDAEAGVGVEPADDLQRRVLRVALPVYVGPGVGVKGEMVWSPVLAGRRQGGGHFHVALPAMLVSVPEEHAAQLAGHLAVAVRADLLQRRRRDANAYLVRGRFWAVAVVATLEQRWLDLHHRRLPRARGCPTHLNLIL